MRTKNGIKKGLVFNETAPFLSNHNGKCPMQNPRFIDDSPLYMVSFVRQKPAEGWSTVLN
jgi:hypothetical protein